MNPNADSRVHRMFKELTKFDWGISLSNSKWLALYVEQVSSEINLEALSWQLRLLRAPDSSVYMIYIYTHSDLEDV